MACQNPIAEMVVESMFRAFAKREAMGVALFNAKGVAKIPREFLRELLETAADEAFKHGVAFARAESEGVK